MRLHQWNMVVCVCVLPLAFFVSLSLARCDLAYRQEYNTVHFTKTPITIIKRMKIFPFSQSDACEIQCSCEHAVCVFTLCFQKWGFKRVVWEFKAPFSVWVVWGIKAAHGAHVSHVPPPSDLNIF